jgi:hypothetical protein
MYTDFTPHFLWYLTTAIHFLATNAGIFCTHFEFAALLNTFPTTVDMSKDTSFRFCIAALLIVQIACWALALVDLFVPGKPRVLVRTTLDIVSQMFAKRSTALLLYKDLRAAF